MEKNSSQVDLITFESVFEDRPMKTLSVLISVLGAIFTVPLIYGIIWFEENNHFRTLINQLVSSICWYLIGYILLVQLFTVFLYIHGPFGSFLCSLDIIFRNVMAMQAIFLLEAIVITKFVFVYVLKNPVAIHDEFLRVFINLSTFTLSFLSQSVYMAMPGRNPLAYYICIGSFPLSKISLQTPVKVNLPVFALLIMSVCVHIYTALKVRKLKKKVTVVKTVEEKVNKRKKVFNVLTDSHMLASFTSNAFSMALLIVGSLINLAFNRVEPQHLNEYVYSCKFLIFFPSHTF